MCLVSDDAAVVPMLQVCCADVAAVVLMLQVCCADVAGGSQSC